MHMPFENRLAAVALAWAFVTSPHAAQAQRAPVVAPVIAQMEHISVATAGTSGSPIVLIPGLASPRAVWDGVVPDLARNHRVFLVQINGFAGDDPRANLKPGVIDGALADLQAYLVRSKLTGVKIVGHSLGGLAALQFAKLHPDAVSAIMVVDSLPFFGALFGPGQTVASIAPQAAAMRDRAAATYTDPAARKAGADAVAQQMALTPAARVSVAGWAAAADPRVSAQAMYEDLTTDLRADLPAIATPITLVYPWNPAGPAKPMADALYRGEYAKAPNVTFVDIGPAAHFVMLDQPEAFARALAAFAK